MSVVEERYEKWVNSPNLDESYKEVLESMNSEEKNDAFYTTIEFGTAGMRGLLGPGTNRINLHTIRKATQGFADYIKEHGEKPVKKVSPSVMTTVICQKNLLLTVQSCLQRMEFVLTYLKVCDQHQN